MTSRDGGDFREAASSDRQLHVEPPSLLSASDDIGRSKDAYLNMARQFEGSAASHTAGFPGESGGAYTSAIDAFAEEDLQLLKILGGLSDALANAASSYTSTDDANADGLNLRMP